MSNNNTDLNLLKIFSKVSELGSFTKAAKVLHQPKSRVSRAISRLEDQLQTQLIRRTTRSSTLTLAGEKLFKNISPLLNQIENELLEVSSHQNEMMGTIRITASQDIGETLVTKIISKYKKKYPEVKIEALITNDYLDLNNENIDIAFRAGKLEDSNLIQRKFLSSEFILVASKKYLRKMGTPSKIEDLEKHEILSFRGIESQFFKNRINIEPKIVSDSIPMVMNMALEGEGIVAIPDFYCSEELKKKNLIHLLPKYKIPAGNIHILYPPNKNLSQRVKEFLRISKELYS